MSFRRGPKKLMALLLNIIILGYVWKDVGIMWDDFRILLLGCFWDTLGLALFCRVPPFQEPPFFPNRIPTVMQPAFALFVWSRRYSEQPPWCSPQTWPGSEQRRLICIGPQIPLDSQTWQWESHHKCVLKWETVKKNKDKEHHLISSECTIGGFR